MWGDPRNEFRRPLHIFFYLLSLPYGAAVRARNRLFDLGALPQQDVGCPVVSVGNLSVGGTGKTPMAIRVAGMLADRGMRPAVLSRGYGGRSAAPVLVVSDGGRILAGPDEAGDEPVLIARRLPGVPVLAGAKRAVTGRYARENLGADVLVLDDGFQHRWIRRDLDIVLLDSRAPLGNGFLLPRGPLREPPEALGRAGAVVFTRSEDTAPPSDKGLAAILRGRPVLRTRIRPVKLVAADGTEMPFPDWRENGSSPSRESPGPIPSGKPSKAWGRTSRGSGPCRIITATGRRTCGGSSARSARRGRRSS